MENKTKSQNARAASKFEELDQIIKDALTGNAVIDDPRIEVMCTLWEMVKQNPKYINEKNEKPVRDTGSEYKTLKKTEKFKEFDTLVKDIVDGQKFDDTGTKIMCTFWEIMKIDPDFDFKGAFSSRLDSDVKSDKRRGKPRAVNSKRSFTTSASSKTSCTGTCVTGDKEMKRAPQTLNSALDSLKKVHQFCIDSQERIKLLTKMEEVLKEHADDLECREKLDIESMRKADEMYFEMDNDYREKLKLIQKQYEELEEQLKSSRNALCESQMEQHQLEQKIARIEKDKEAAQKEIQTVRAEICRVDKDIESIKYKIKTKEINLGKINEQISRRKESMQAELNSMNAEYNKYLAECKAVQKEKIDTSANLLRGKIEKSLETENKIQRELLRAKIQREHLMSEAQTLRLDIEVTENAICNNNKKTKKEAFEIEEEMIKVEFEINNFEHSCKHQDSCVCTLDLFKCCTDCSRCNANRISIIECQDFCPCNSTKCKLLTVYLDFLSDALGEHIKTKATDDIADMIIQSLTKDNRLDRKTQDTVKNYFNSLVCMNIMDCLKKATRKTLCELPFDVYTELLSCIPQKKSKQCKICNTTPEKPLKMKDCHCEYESTTCNCKGKLCNWGSLSSSASSPTRDSPQKQSCACRKTNTKKHTQIICLSPEVGTESSSPTPQCQGKLPKKPSCECRKASRSLSFQDTSLIPATSCACKKAKSKLAPSQTQSKSCFCKDDQTGSSNNTTGDVNAQLVTEIVKLFEDTFRPLTQMKNKSQSKSRDLVTSFSDSKSTNESKSVIRFTSAKQLHFATVNRQSLSKELLRIEDNKEECASQLLEDIFYDALEDSIHDMNDELRALSSNSMFNRYDSDDKIYTESSEQLRNEIKQQLDVLAEKIDALKYEKESLEDFDVLEQNESDGSQLGDHDNYMKPTDEDEAEFRNHVMDIIASIKECENKFKSSAEIQTTFHTEENNDIGVMVKVSDISSSSFTFEHRVKNVNEENLLTEDEKLIVNVENEDDDEKYNGDEKYNIDDENENDIEEVDAGYCDGTNSDDDSYNFDTDWENSSSNTQKEFDGDNNDPFETDKGKTSNRSNFLESSGLYSIDEEKEHMQFMKNPAEFAFRQRCKKQLYESDSKINRNENIEAVGILDIPNITDDDINDRENYSSRTHKTTRPSSGRNKVSFTEPLKMQSGQHYRINPFKHVSKTHCKKRKIPHLALPPFLFCKP